MRLMLALFLALLATGCEVVETEGPDAQGYSWVRDGPSAPPEYHYGVDVFLNCGLAHGAKSCAIQGRGDGLCHIYLPTDAESWQKPHEEKHCAGWRHPDPLR